MRYPESEQEDGSDSSQSRSLPPHHRRAHHFRRARHLLDACTNMHCKHLSLRLRVPHVTHPPQVTVTTIWVYEPSCLAIERLELNTSLAFQVEALGRRCCNGGRP